MGIECWRDYDLPKRKTCPECGGSGKDNATLDWKCWRCNGSGDRICDTCIKLDVCMLSNDLNKAVKDIKDISERTGVFIDTDIRCKKWFGKVVNTRD